jgi:hypothetical protein
MREGMEPDAIYFIESRRHFWNHWGRCSGPDSDLAYMVRLKKVFEETRREVVG